VVRRPANRAGPVADIVAQQQIDLVIATAKIRHPASHHAPACDELLGMGIEVLTGAPHWDRKEILEYCRTARLLRPEISRKGRREPDLCGRR